MNHKSIKHATGLCVVFLLLAQCAFAIKIVVPDQYKEQVDAIKRAEQAERRSDLQGDVKETGGISIAAEGKPAGNPKVDADEFLVQSVVEATATASAFEGNLAADEGLVSGQIVDKETGEALSGVAIIIEGTDIATVTAEDGRYSLGPTTAGTFTLSFIKSGYIEANIIDYKIVGGEVSVFPFALPPRPIEMSDEVYELQDFTVTAQEANEMMMKLDMRMSSNQALAILSSEDFSKFVASDVADAIKRVTGVTIQEGSFAVIRGLDERYNSTLFNGAPLPSPDPEKQSVPLDLFPSEIVSNLVVSKTFSPGMPGNSTGGSIQIQSASFPADPGIYADVSLKTGFNTNAEDEYYGDGGRKSVDIDFEDLGSFSNEQIAEDYNNLSGRLTPELSEAEPDKSFRLKLSAVTERTRFFVSASKSEKYRSRIGSQETRTGVPGFVTFLGDVRSSGDLALGQLTDTSGNYDTNTSTYEDRNTFYLTAEHDLHKDGNHTLGIVAFKNSEERVGARVFSNGTFENYDPNRNGRLDEGDILGTGGPIGQFSNSLLKAFYGSKIINSNFADFLSSSLYKRSLFEDEREIEVGQLYGKHAFEVGASSGLLSKLDSSELKWILSESNTEQKESGAVNVAGFQLADGSFITGGDTEGSINDFTTPTVSWRLTQEEQSFQRFEFATDSERQLSFRFGAALEDSERLSKQEYYVLNKDFVEYQDVGSSGTSQSYPTAEGASNHTSGNSSAWANLSGASDPAAEAESSREIQDYFFSGKIKTDFGLDIEIGAQYEKIFMDTQTVPGAFGDDFFNFDILRKGAVFDSSSPAFTNYQILGYDDALEIDFAEAIDEAHWLPSIIFNYRPRKDVRLLFAYSETVTRPSFREFTYLTTQDPISGDFFTGNPLLQTSLAQNYDFRAEYFRENGDMIALGLFYKEIDQPIEKTVLSGSDATSEIFFNNPNQATVMGIELEVRKELAFINLPFFEYFSLGGNVAFISSAVDVLDSIRAVHEEGFERNDGVVVGGDYYADETTGSFTGFETERALVNQPDWIYNLYATFEHPDWGTTATLSVFSQSDMLLTASSITGGKITPDRYMASYEEVNFSLSQRINDYLTLKFSAENLLNGDREVVYDQDLFPDLEPERSYTLGRTYSISLSASF